ncbi:zinc-binding dehydrogenase [bacterium]|nr:zinc-binding dehydrogenase [bacterium]MBU1675079.1 zinc-binding dehydrogenase [bacterium]
MRQVWITRTGEPEVMEVRESTDPSPGPGTVRVRAAAAGVNFADVMIRIGLYPDAPRLPMVPGYEIAGVVDAVGEGVSESRLGEHVLALCGFGGYSDVVCVPSRHTYRLPDGLSLAAAAALPVNYLTAYQMLEVMAPPREGETVLVHGAAGGVGLAAVQLSRLRGARVLGSASPAKHDFLRERGVDFCLDSRQRHFAAEVRAATGGRGVDIALEPRHGRWIRESYEALAPAGRLVLFGFADAARSKRGGRLDVLRTLAGVPWLGLNPIRLMNDNKGVLGVNLGRMWGEQERVAAWMNRLLAWAGEGRIRPHVDRTFPLTDAASAHHYLQDRRNRGKVLLVDEAAVAAGLVAAVPGEEPE